MVGEQEIEGGVRSGTRNFRESDGAESALDDFEFRQNQGVANTNGHTKTREKNGDKDDDGRERSRSRKKSNKISRSKGGKVGQREVTDLCPRGIYCPDFCFLSRFPDHFFLS